jgi:hypothetical protein
MLQALFHWKKARGTSHLVAKRRADPPHVKAADGGAHTSVIRV